MTILFQLLHIAFESNNKQIGMTRCHQPAGKCCTFTRCRTSVEQKIIYWHSVLCTKLMVSYYTKDKILQDCLCTCRTKHMICKSFIPVFLAEIFV